MLTLRLGILILLALTPASSLPLKGVKGTDSDAPKVVPVSVVASPKATPVPVQPLVVLPKVVDQPTEKIDLRKKLIATFQSYVGIKEEPLGSNQGKMVNKFNLSAGFKPSDEAPWCASVTHYGYQENGLKGRGAYSPSWFVKSREVSRNDVEPADVALVYFASKGRYAHTIACVEKVTRSAGRVVQVTTLEGNTNAQGSREGDQFARRVRPADSLTFVRWWNQ